MRHATSWIERERERSEKQRGEAREEKKRRRNRSVRGWNRGESRYSEARDTGPCFIYPTPPIILTDPYPLQLSEMTHRAANFSNQIDVIRKSFKNQNPSLLNKDENPVKIHSFQSNFYNGTSTEKIESIRERRGARTWTLFRSVTVMGATLSSHLRFVLVSFRLELSLARWESVQQTLEKG